MPIWQIHRAIGIGSDRVVEMLAGAQIEQELGETLRAAEGPLYQETIDEVEPTKGAHELLHALKRAGHGCAVPMPRTRRWRTESGEGDVSRRRAGSRCSSFRTRR